MPVDALGLKVHARLLVAMVLSILLPQKLRYCVLVPSYSDSRVYQPPIENLIAEFHLRWIMYSTTMDIIRHDHGL